jgi:hypothetical protein
MAYLPKWNGLSDRNAETRRLIDGALRIEFGRDISAASALPGTFFAMLSWPPSSVPASNNETVCPRRAASIANANPAGPPPTTAIRLDADTAKTFGKSISRHARIDEAGRDLIGEDVVETRLVAGDASVDLVCAAEARFSRELFVGKKWAGHRD